MVGHQDVGMRDAARGKRAFAQKLQVTAAVTVVQEAGQSIVAALDNVLRYAGNIESRLACHAKSLTARIDGESRYRLMQCVGLALTG